MGSFRILQRLLAIITSISYTSKHSLPSFYLQNEVANKNTRKEDDNVTLTQNHIDNIDDTT